MIEKAQKVGFFSPDKPENHTDKGKGKNKKKERGGRKEEKGGGGGWGESDVCTQNFILATLHEKKKQKQKLLDEIGLFGGNAFQNPATDIFCA